MKWIFSILLLLVSSTSFGQGFSYSYVDPCSKKTNTVYIPSGQNSVTVSYYGVANTFTQADFQNGTFSAWMYSVSAASTQPCQGLKTETQTKQNTIITNNIISTLTSVTAAATMSVTSSISTVSSQSAGNALGNSVNNSSDNSNGGGSSKENKDGQNNSGSKSNNQESGTSGQSQGGGTTTNSSQGSNKTEGGSTSGTNQPSEGGNQPSGSSVGGNTAQNGQNTGQNQPNTSLNTNKTEPNTGNSGSNTTNPSNTPKTGTNSGSNGGNNTQSGTNSGSNTNNSGGSNSSGNSSGNNSGNSGSNTNNSGGSNGSGGGNGGTDQKTNTNDPTTTPTDSKSGGNGGTTNSVANAAEASSGGSTSNASEGSGGGSSKGGAKSNVRVGSIIGTGDIVAIRSAEDNSNSFKATMSVTKSNTDNSRAKGALLNFTTAINNSNLTFYGAFTNKAKSNTLICANSTMINFDYDLFNTSTVLESHRWNKLSLMGGLNYTVGSMAGTSFNNISAVGGGFYMFKVSKNLSGNMLLLAVYSPFTKFYEGTWWQSGTLLVPFSSWDYSISKNFKYNVSFSGTWEVGKSVLQYQILTGGKIML